MNRLRKVIFITTTSLLTLFIFLATVPLYPAFADCTGPSLSGDCPDTIVGTTGDDNIVVDAPGGDLEPNAVDDDSANVIFGDIGPTDPAGPNGNDTITVNGGSVNTIVGDVFSGTGSGNDTITINGGVVGDIAGDASLGTGMGNDTVNLNGGFVTGSINGQGNLAIGDTLNFNFTPDTQTEADQFATDFNALNDPGTGPGTGPGSFNIDFKGHTYHWEQFEHVNNNVQYIAQMVQVIVIGIQTEDTNSDPDCGRNPYAGERRFNQFCQAYTGDPEEKICHGLTYAEAVELGLISP